jgi:hypothetical protein
MTSKQNVRAGDRSLNVQIDTVHYGLSYSDAREMMLDLFKENFPKLQEEAIATVIARSEEITDQFLRKVCRSSSRSAC